MSIILSPQGAYLILDFAEEGLIERGELLETGSLFTGSSEKDIFGSFSVLFLSHILWNQHEILLLKYITSTQFLSQTILNLTCMVV